EPAPLPAPDSVPTPPAAPLTIDAPSVQNAIDTTVEHATTAAQVWTEPAYDAVQGFTAKALEQPQVAQTVESVRSAAAPLVDQATAALGGLQAAFAPA
ncbi:hypothetical protein HQO87_25880, partial [Rhodococcus fascians]|nr:hypothetical protein [Rhodococcus fascians]